MNCSINLFQGADPDAEDGFGNTVLHMVVVTNQMVFIVLFPIVKSYDSTKHNK